MPKAVIMPALGMAQESGLLLAWLKDENEFVEKGEPLIEIETDKITVEVESNATGKLVNIVGKVGEDIPVGEVIAYIMYDGETLADIPQSEKAILETPSVEHVLESESVLSVSPVAARMLKEHNLAENDIPASNGRIKKADVEAYLSQQQTSTLFRLIPASPKARRLAQEKGYDLGEILGTGPDNAVLTQDVLDYVPRVETSVVTDKAIASRDTIDLSRSWKVMAKRLETSWQTIPHFYLKRHINVDALIDWRDSLQQTGLNVTYTDLLVKVVAMVLAQHPMLNASMDGEILYRNDEVNIGLAIAVDDGLLVPVIHQADILGLGKISDRRAELIELAQSKSLKPSDVQNGTFTISNLGMYGIDEFSAIVNPPQVAILAVGAIQSHLEMINDAVVETKTMTLSLSCDHRAVDGANGAKFLQTIARYMQDPRLMLS
jgi:pyruvate dehydrogenase E2 component (dihydrolipoamide acetyltransferase)